MMNHECTSVQTPDRTPCDDGALRIDEDQITRLQPRPRHAKGVHPETGRVDRVLDGDVARDALVVPVLRKDPEGQCESTLEMGTVLVRVLKRRWAGDVPGDGDCVVGLVIFAIAIARGGRILFDGIVIVVMVGKTQYLRCCGCRGLCC